MPTRIENLHLVDRMSHFEKYKGTDFFVAYMPSYLGIAEHVRSFPYGNYNWVEVHGALLDSATGLANYRAGNGDITRSISDVNNPPNYFTFGQAKFEPTPVGFLPKEVVLSPEYGQASVRIGFDNDSNPPKRVVAFYCNDAESRTVELWYVADRIRRVRFYESAPPRFTYAFDIADEQLYEALQRKVKIYPTPIGQFVLTYDPDDYVMNLRRFEKGKLLDGMDLSVILDGAEVIHGLFAPKLLVNPFEMLYTPDAPEVDSWLYADIQALHRMKWESYHLKPRK